MPVNTFRGLRALLVVHGFITLAAGIVLTVAPSFIPHIVGIHLEPSAYLLAYLLAGSEFGFAVLSFGGSRLANPRSLRLIAWSCAALHGSSAVLELYAAYGRDASVVILGNAAARIVIAALFIWLARSAPLSPR
jgi:hypothetical protein